MDTLGRAIVYHQFLSRRCLGLYVHVQVYTHTFHYDMSVLALYVYGCGLLRVFCVFFHSHYTLCQCSIVCVQCNITYIGVSQYHFAEGVVGADDKRGAEVGGECQGGVATRLDHALLLSPPRQHTPLVHCSIHTATDDVCVVWTPLDTANLHTHNGI